ncbi:MAG: hypothetical protein WDO12_11915 [Pseudomonadota bacterium]
MATLASRIGFEESVVDRATSGGPGAVSWPAVFAGATAAAALSLILLVLGVGLGLSSVSPWADRGASAEGITWSTIAWIAFCAVASSGLGGYIAGRLRVRWPQLHTDEVYFRDTAHGFLAWGVATIITAATLGTAIGAVLGTGAKVAAGAATSVAQVAAPAIAGQPAQNNPLRYSVDSLFRANPGTAVPAASEANAANVRGEVSTIFDNSLRTGALSPQDTQYVAQVVAQNTGLSQADAESRVSTIYNDAQLKLQRAAATARQAADQARRAAATTALWVFVSLLLGAFCASLMATWGGRRRDLY